MKKILIALDYEESAEKIAKAGYDLAKSMNASVILLHVTADPTYYSSLNYSPIFGFDSFSNLDILQEDAIQQIEKAALGYVQHMKDRLGDNSIQIEIRSGDFGDNILDIAAELNTDIIVMGTHSRSALDNFLMGSVAKKVIQKSTIPIFIIPIKD
ncbi:MAG: universal stress protein [Ginsengibacter sp.]|jgi:nucleotide-binding universal stress UspA family protein